MDSVVSTALEEICAEGPGGIPLAKLWSCLKSSLASSGLRIGEVGVREVIWSRLVGLPGLQFEARGSPLEPQALLMQSVEDFEKLGVRIVADEHLRCSFLGIYDMISANVDISPLMRRLLERLAVARTNGVTQNQLSKEFKVKPNNLFYFVKRLECQGLIVRRSTIVRTKEAGYECEDVMKDASITNTNLIFLYRYANHLTSQQRLEITKPDVLESIGDVDKNSLAGCDAFGKFSKDDVRVKDFLPDFKAICDVLEEANEKECVISDIKLALNYRMQQGHRAWRNICNRMKDAHLVEEFQAINNGKVVKCLRLLKKFDPKDFEPKTSMCGYEGFASGHLMKCDRRGQTNDQFVELPIEHQIYDIIDFEGPKGITCFEIGKRLGLNSKRTDARISDMCQRTPKRFPLVRQAEIQNRTMVYRVWTLKNFEIYSSTVSPTKSEANLGSNELSIPCLMDLIPHEQISRNPLQLDSSPKDLHHKKICSLQLDSELISEHSNHADENQITITGANPQNLVQDPPDIHCDTKLIEASKSSESEGVQSERPLSVLSAPNLLSLHGYSTLATMDSTQREQRILMILQKEKFILKVELYRWLEGLHKDKQTTMGRKTLTRSLLNLQSEGQCRCVKLTIPVLSNCRRNRVTDVILHPSIESLSSKVVSQICERFRRFDMQIRGHGLIRSKNDQYAELMEVKRPANHLASDAQTLKPMRANGYVQARMVRAKLLHNFLWNNLRSLPDWDAELLTRKCASDLKNPQNTLRTFSLEAAIESMPFELFLQVAGSPNKIDNLVERCKLKLRLSDLPVHEYKCFMNTQGAGRLSRTIDILSRLKLVQLTTEEAMMDVNLHQHCVLKHAMELKPYIEVPTTRPSSRASSYGYRSRLRHDFLLISKEDVDSYWQTLEYCYVAADRSAASHAFPGSAVPEVFNARSWSSVRVMTAEQRTELLKRVGKERSSSRISVRDCVQISKELNLSLDQVLRVSYDKRNSSFVEICRISRTEEQDWHLNKSKSRSKSIKRKRPLKNCPLSQAEADTRVEELNTSGTPIITGNDELNIEERTSSPTVAGKTDVALEDCEVGTDLASAEQFGINGKDENSPSISQCAFAGIKFMRHRKFFWSNSSDRQLITEYARYRATLGGKFCRVVWASITNLPTVPAACKRRMIALKQNVIIKKALVKLCNLLAERYIKYLNNTLEKRVRNYNDPKTITRDLSMEGGLDQNVSAPHGENIGSNVQEHWDDFENPKVKMAVNEVLRCKMMSKLQSGKGIKSRHEKEGSDVTHTDKSDLDGHASVAVGKENLVFSSSAEQTYDDTGGQSNASRMVYLSGRRKTSSQRLPVKILRVLDSRSISISRQVYESLSVATAVELFKLVYLSTSTAPEVRSLLTNTLRCYPEPDLLAAFNSLKDKKFMASGHGNQQFVLSRKFYQNVYSSPFPIDTGKRAANFSAWLHKQENDLKEDGIYLDIDLQCAEIFHLFALVSSEELFVSPCLPSEGIGEADEKKNLKCMSAEDKQICGDKALKHQYLWKKDNEPCNRREKGFPGIRLLLNRAKIPIPEAVEVLIEKERNISPPRYAGKYRESCFNQETVEAPFQNGSDSCHEIINNVNIASTKVILNESLWEAMAGYAEHLSSTVDWNQEAIFSPDVIKFIYSAIHQAGEQGLNMVEISEAINMQGNQFVEIAVDIVEEFQLIIKNGFSYFPSLKTL